MKEKLEIVRTTTWSAGPGCHGGCGVLAHIKDGKLVRGGRQNIYFVETDGPLYRKYVIQVLGE